MAIGIARILNASPLDQYHPAHKAQTEPQFSEINRRISRLEFEQALAYADEAGLWRLDTRGPAVQ